MWQHSACLGVTQADAEKEDFQFVCIDCKRKEEDAKKPKIPSLKFKVSPKNNKTKVYDQDAINGLSNSSASPEVSDVAGVSTVPHSTIRVEVPKRAVDVIPVANGSTQAHTDPTNTVKLNNGISNVQQPHFIKEQESQAQPQSNGIGVKHHVPTPETLIKITTINGIGNVHTEEIIKPEMNGTGNAISNKETSKPKTNGVPENMDTPMTESNDVEMVNA